MNQTSTSPDRDSRGFGIVELALTIIVLGIVFVLTLKGTALIPHMRAFVVGHQIDQFRAAVLQYQNDYRNMPGDDPAAAKRWLRGDALYTTGGRVLSLAGDGRIDGFLDDPSNAAGEQYTAWGDLRRAGYVEGDPTLVGISARPENTYGGAFGFAAENLGMKQVLCVTRVPGADAALLDKRFDDDSISTGQMRGTSQWDPAGRNNSFPEPDVESYHPEKTYIICVPNVP